MAARLQMSHTVTVTRTTTATTTSAIILNTGYCKTVPGLLKIAEVLVGLALLILFIVYSDYFYLVTRNGFTSDMYLLLTVFACLVGSTCLLISCLFSLSTSSIIAKTLYEFIFHGIAFLLYLISILLCFVKDNRRNSEHPYSTTAILGAIMIVLYFGSTVLAYRSYRGA